LAAGTIADDSAARAVPFEARQPLPSLGSLIDALESPGKGLIMLMGKGGVGKTTAAAAIAAELAGRGHEVLLTTTDPAANLAQTLDGAFEHLTVSRIDPALETQRYRDHVLETTGKDLDAGARALLEEDLRSPCTEEIAVFQAFSRVIRESSRHFVVVDTAPTGHTLLLLDATGAYHRDIMRHVAQGGGKVVTPMMRLQDPEQTQILIVTLAETTPVLEATALQNDLRRAGIEPWGWVINASLAAAETTHPLLVRRAADELKQIETVRSGLAARFAVIPMLAEEPVGADRLRALGRPGAHSLAGSF
jgi:arsenite-transporting ATPase